MSFWFTIFVILCIFVTPIIFSYFILNNKFSVSLQTKEDKAIIGVFSIFFAWFILLAWLFFKVFNFFFGDKK